MNKEYGYLCIFILLFHIVLVAWSSWIHSPSTDEAAHLPSGLTILKQRRFDTYTVNPPLVRMVAALPLCHSCLNIPDVHVDHSRPEFFVGFKFLEENQNTFRKYFFWGRLACLPFSLLGAVACFLWAHELFGRISGLTALVFWCFSPNIIAHASTIGPDVAASSLGLLTCYLFSKWLLNPSLKTTLTLGVVLGLAESAKMSWIIFVVIFPLILLLKYLRTHKTSKINYAKASIFLFFSFLIALLVLNALYCFNGSMTKFGNIPFQSRFFQKIQKTELLGISSSEIPLPFPVDYIKGMDLQKADFESGRFDSYLLGTWQKKRGWYCYYTIGMLVKVPTPILALSIISLALTFLLRQQFIKEHNLYCLLIPPLIFFVFISSQNGFSRHFRYVLPVLPFLYILASGCMGKTIQNKKVYGFSILMVAGTVMSSLLSYPNSASYFNAIAGGTKNGYTILLDSSVDWGQDFYLLKDWQDKHPEANPFFLCCYSEIPPEVYGIRYNGKPVGTGSSSKFGEIIEPPAGWYAISVHELMHYSNNFAFFRSLKPHTRIGGSINIYHVHAMKGKN